MQQSLKNKLLDTSRGNGRIQECNGAIAPPPQLSILEQFSQSIFVPISTLYQNPEFAPGRLEVQRTVNSENPALEYTSSFIHFENIVSFYVKLGFDICPRVDNQTSGDTLQDSTRPLVEILPSASYPPMGIRASFWWWDALPHQPVRIREETLESENLFSSS